MSALIDLRQNNALDIWIDKGTTGNVTFALPSALTLDSAYTLVLDPELTTEQTYSVGSGITLDVPNNSFTWAWSTELSQERTYIGFLESDSQAIGTYFKVLIRINVSE